MHEVADLSEEERSRLLAERNVPPAILRQYAMFIENLLLDAGASRYLSKMNQGIDKLESLAVYFERSIFLVPFRDPLRVVRLSDEALERLIVAMAILPREAT